MHFGLHSKPGLPEVALVRGPAQAVRGEVFRRGVPRKVPWNTLKDFTGWQSSGEFMRSDQVFRQINLWLAARLPAGSEVVVIRDVGLGDVVMASAAVRALARAKPHWKVSFFTSKRYAPLFDGPWEAEGVGFLEEVRGRFQNVFDQRWLVERDPQKDVEDRKRIFFRNLGLPFPERLDAPIFVSREAEEQATALLGPTGRFPLALICPESSGSPRSFGERAVEQIRRLVIAQGMAPVVVGERRVKRDGGLLDLTGRTSVTVLAALVKRAAIVYATDSGPMHLAGLMGRPCVAYFNEVRPELRCEGYPSVVPIWQLGSLDVLNQAELSSATTMAMEQSTVEVA